MNKNPARGSRPRKPSTPPGMKGALRLLGNLARSNQIDKLGLRKPTEKLLYTGTRAGFKIATIASRGFSGGAKADAPARLNASRSSGLFDLTPTEEQQMLRDTALSFATEQLRPAATAADAACAAPAELLKQSAELGLSLIGVPESLGGAGSERSAVSNALVAEALAQGDMGLAVACLAPVAVSTALVLWGDEQQQADYLPAFVGDNAPAAALAVLEPRPLFDPFRPATRARLVEGGWELEGLKSMVPLAAQAELFIVAAQIEDGLPALFIVESSTAGLALEAEPAMGLRAAATARLKLSNVRLPLTARLTHDYESYADCIRLGRLGWCSLAVGCGQAAIDYMVPYVNERVAFGEPISHRQAVAFAIANMGIELEGMRLLTLRAASLAERGQPYAEPAALARRLCADKGMQIASDAVQLLGGHGFVKEHPAERWYRDMRAVAFMEGVVLV